MLTRLQFKNWRSLQGVEVNDLTPITVFIGENSSGKTNLLDALYFLREATKEGVLQALLGRGGFEKVRTVGVGIQDAVELSVSFIPDSESGELTYTLTLREKGAIPEVDELLVDGQGNVRLHSDSEGVKIRSKDGELRSVSDAPFGYEETVLSAFGRTTAYEQIFPAFQFITRRWQLLDENFLPNLSLPAGLSGDPYVIDPCADNVPIMLDFLKKVDSKEYDDLQADLKWLLGHVQNLDIESNDRETRFLINEKAHRGQEAPTISAGTERIAAILAAVHALNLRTSKDAGLVVIEEPDMAVHPLLLSRLVELLRSVVTGENRRQVILTTHSPRLLDYFKPEEVRVVERNARGMTTVNNVSNEIARVWLDEYGLGDVWMTRALGGVPG